MNGKPDWLKTKGYLHITPSLNIQRNWKKYIRQIQSTSYVATYAFYPLLHRIKSERRYDKPTKKRPLHYATHFDSLIYAYYARKLGELHEEQLKADPELNNAVLAYRSIPVSDSSQKGKSNIHFAKEVFQEINARVEREGQTAVLAVDLKSFFSSLSHDYLYSSWAKLLDKDALPADHQNVFNACTNFSYILYDHLRKYPKGPLDEAHLASIRKKYGYKCFFATNEEFRKEIKKGNLRIYKNPFRRSNEDGSKEMTGIPQGLPVSSVLSNIYLLDFDRKVVEALVKNEGVHYRRYSDDIIIICSPDKVEKVTNFIKNLIKEYAIKISTEKTKQFLFRKMVYNKNGDQRITAIKIKDNSRQIDTPLTYLGFEFRGYNTLIKSANLAKYYRRLIYLIKNRAKRAIKTSRHNPHIPRAVFLNQIKKLYNAPLKHTDKTENKQAFRSRYNLRVDDRGDFHFDHYDIEIKNQSNFISYVNRCDKIFQTNDFSRQLKKKEQIIGQAINRHLLAKKD